MHKINSFLALTVLLNLVTTIASSQAVMGAREVGMGQAVTALPESEWSVFSNPALLSMEKKGVSFFGIRYYGLSEITDMAVSVNLPSSIGVMAAGIHRYGFELFSRNRIRLAYKNQYRGFHVGAVLNYSHVTQGGGYGSTGAFGIDLGIATRLSENLWVGGKTTNVNRPDFGKDEELPRDMSVGFSYKLSDLLLFSSDVVKDVRFPISYRGGIEINFIERLFGRIGITTEPTTFSLGVGFQSVKWSVNITAQNHQILGVSPGFDFSIHW